MKSYVRWIILAAGIVAALGLFLLVRPGGSPVAPAPTFPAPSASLSPSRTDSSTVEPSPTLSPASEGTLIQVRVRNGKVEGPSEPQVQQGQEVRIVVDADVADEVHVHGYDLMAEVEPRRPAELTFRAIAPGVFEVELEDAGLLLFQLKVVP